MENSVFVELNKVNVNEHVEKKNTGRANLSYLSWCWAWAEVKKRYPNASYEIVKFENGLPYCFDPNTGYMVYTKVTIEGITHEMWLPVMDSHNDAMLDKPYEVKTKYNSYTVAKCTMFDVNKTIMRCLTKNLAMFGLGLYIYAGEDLPEDEANNKTASQPDNSPIPDDGELVNQVMILEGYINDGNFNDSDKRRLQACIGRKDIEEIKRAIDWCKTQKSE